MISVRTLLKCGGQAAPGLFAVDALHTLLGLYVKGRHYRALIELIPHGALLE